MAFIDQFLRTRQASAQGRYVTAYVDNSLHAHRIVKLMPDARIVLLVRHPQENVWSLLNAFFAPGWLREARNVELVTEAEIVKATNIWKERAQVALRALAGELGNNVLVVRQERMVKDPEGVARELLAFVDAPYEQMVADSLAYGIINTSFPPGREPSQQSFMERVPVANQAEREAFFEKSRAKLAKHRRICEVVRSLTGHEMQLLGYEDVLKTAAGMENGAAEGPAAVRKGELKEVGVFGAATGGEAQTAFLPGDEATLRVVVRANEAIRRPSISFLVRDETGISLFGTTTFDEGMMLPDLGKGEQLEVRFKFPVMTAAGRYRVCVAFNSVSLPGYEDNVLYHQLDDVASFEVAKVASRPIHYKFLAPVAIEYAKEGGKATG